MGAWDADALSEFKPLVEEYRELEQVARCIGLNADDDASVADEQRPASRGTARRRRRGSKVRSAASARDESGGPAAAKRSTARTPGQRECASRRPGRGAPGSNRSSRRQQDVLRLVSERPGITVRQIAEELEVDATGLYRPVHRLDQEGAFSKRGTALHPAGRSK
jgi:DNA-binding NarL/FixJ family response regulator